MGKFASRFDALKSAANEWMDGLRVTLRTSQPYTLQIRQARVKIGRRVYFRTADIASYLSQAGA